MKLEVVIEIDYHFEINGMAIKDAILNGGDIPSQCSEEYRQKMNQRNEIRTALYRGEITVEKVS